MPEDGAMSKTTVQQEMTVTLGWPDQHSIQLHGVDRVQQSWAGDEWVVAVWWADQDREREVYTGKDLRILRAEVGP